jgi:hypothetical protein
MIDKLFHRILRRMDYISDQSGIYNRYAREMENWSSHLERTKEYITGFIQRHSFHTLTILGSGWLLDLPVELLSRNLRKIFLYDVFHPVQIRKKLRSYKCFELIDSDITGGLIENVYSAVELYKKNKKKTGITDLEFTGFNPVEETDGYISLNILNQLDMLIIDFLEKKQIYAEQELKMLRKIIQQNHLNALPKDKSCLVTDFEELIYRKKEVPEISRHLLYAELPEGNNVQTWEWLFDTTGSYHKGCKTIFRVIAMEI